MKKVIITILALAGILLGCPDGLMARRYTTPPTPPPIIRTPVVATMSLDEVTGEVSFYFVSAVTDATITLVQDKTVVDSVNFSASANQTVYYELEDFANGDYTLILSSGDGATQTYYITIED